VGAAGTSGGTANQGGIGNQAYIDEVGHFDTRVFDSTTPCGLLNVMMIERREWDEVVSWVTIGRIYVATFMDARPCEREVILE
jgi:hypothetical protein